MEQHLTPTEFLRVPTALQVSGSHLRQLGSCVLSIALRLSYRHRWAPEVPIAHLVVTQSGHHRVRSACQIASSDSALLRLEFHPRILKYPLIEVLACDRRIYDPTVDQSVSIPKTRWSIAPNLTSILPPILTAGFKPNKTRLIFCDRSRDGKMMDSPCRPPLLLK